MGYGRMDWLKVKENVEILLKEFQKFDSKQLDDSQKRAIRRAADMLVKHGVILADEVGLGKTRIALVIGEAVMRAGGTVATVVPPGLLYQWEQEAKTIFKKFPDSKLIEHIVHLRSFDNLFNEKDFPILKCDKASWVLASQNFGFLTKVTNNNRRYDFFTLIKYNLLQKKSKEWKDLQEKIEKRNKKFFECIKKAAKYLAGKKRISNNEIWAKFKKPSDDFSLKEKFFGNENGRDLAFACIGKLLGPVDFLIIDEAHKSREMVSDGTQVSQKRLSQLIENIIVQKGDYRRFCMTATPIELHSEQWKDLFCRCKLQMDGEESELDCENNYIENFEKALEAARKNPKSPELLDNLIKASKTFKTKMSEYVIRRKRTNNRVYLERIEKLGLDKNTVDPHVEIHELKIDPEDLKESKKIQRNWKKAVYCFEGISLASQGIDAKQKSKMQRYRYASGLMDFEDVSEDFDKIEDCPQKDRMRFWHEQSKKLLQGDKFALYSHPRIITTAKEIWDKVKVSKEKILVFGTYRKPTEALRNTLNALYIIDCARANPVKPTNRMGLSYEQIYAVYQQFYGVWDIAELQRRVEKCEAANEKFMKRLLRDFDNARICKEMKLESLDENEQDEIGKRIRSDLADVLRELDEERRRKKGNKIFEDICDAYCKGITDQFKTEKDQNEDEGVADESSRKEKLFEALGLGKDKNMSRRHSAFCRLMDGEMKMSTRRVVQELFNRQDTFPKVLIAQSSVGREGLNLQGACRNVYIFHPEWNPAVIEQEIGRVDRMGSLWEKLVDDWHEGEEKPKVVVTFVVFKGTYDEHQYNVYATRRKMLDSQLSGILLEDKADEISQEYKVKLAAAAPNFEP